MDGACVGMAPHPSCPASPGEAPSLCALHGGGFRASRVPCGSNVVVWWSGGTQGFTCLYDQQGALIGTGAAIDSPSYCGGNATWRWGTEIPRSCVQLSDPNLCTP
jgi:hypothetical protein